MMVKIKEVILVVTIEMPFNTFMTEFFEGSDIEELIKHMFAHFKMQVENP